MIWGLRPGIELKDMVRCTVCPWRMDKDDFYVFECKDFPLDMHLLGTGNFRSLRIHDEKVPIMVLPEAVSEGLQFFGEKRYLLLRLEPADVGVFGSVVDWCSTKSDKKFHGILGGGGCVVKVKVPDWFELFDVDGNLLADVCAGERGLQCGNRLRCAVELPWLWENSSSFGLTMQLVQAKVVLERKCLIVDVDEEEPVEFLTPAPVPGYLPVTDSEL